MLVTRRKGSLYELTAAASLLMAALAAAAAHKAILRTRGRHPTCFR